MAVPVFTWSGFYVGVNAGYGWQDHTDNHFHSDAFTTFTVSGPGNTRLPLAGISRQHSVFGSGNRQGFVGGSQIGATYQFTPGNGFVIGIEADIQGTTFGGRGHDGFFNTDPSFHTVTPTGFVLGPPTITPNTLTIPGQAIAIPGQAITIPGQTIDIPVQASTAGLVCLVGANGAPVAGVACPAPLPANFLANFGVPNPGGAPPIFFGVFPINAQPVQVTTQAVQVNTQAVTVNTQPITVALPPTITPGAPLPGLGVAPGSGPNVLLFNNGALSSGGNRRGLDWFSTVRGRLGYAFDRLMVFGTGGVAFTDGGGSRDKGFVGFGVPSFASIPTAFFVSPAAAAQGAAVLTSAQAAPVFSNRRRWDDIGLVAGGGVEYAFTHNITAKIEGLWVTFREDKRSAFVGDTVVGLTNTGAAITASSLGVRRRADFGVIRAGVNFKFSTF